MTQKKHLLIIMIAAVTIFSTGAAWAKQAIADSVMDTVSTVIDTVMVPVNILRLTGITQSGSSSIYNYSGQVTYNLHLGACDSLNVGLSFVPVNGGATVLPTWDSGSVGIVSFANGMNGKNYINFRCSINGQPTGTYMARITMIDTFSHITEATDSLLAMMTTQNKIDQLHGTGSARMSPDITNLGIPGYYMSNGPTSPCDGVSGTSTAFPTGCATTCTFDTALIDSMGVDLAQEFYAKGIYILEGPMMNTVRDPRGGRDWETFGEDPYLSGQIAAAYIRGVQSEKCVPMAKHWVCNDMENNRGTYSANISERTLREIYAMPFEYAVKEGCVLSVMSAYNKVNSTYCSQNSHTLTDILKTDWGFRGFVCSDLGGMHSTVPAANAGQDVELYNDSFFTQSLLGAAITDSQVTMRRLNDMARRILRVKVWAGLIGKIGEAAVTQFTSTLNSAAHQALDLEIAQKSIVVVKNNPFGAGTTPLLPLSKSDTVSLVGPYYSAARTDPGGSGTSGRNCPSTTVSPIQGITTEIGSGKVLDSSKWKNANVVIAFLGVSGEGEGADRTTDSLQPPAGQIAMVNNIIAAGKKCVVVLTGGSAAVKDIWDSVPAVVVAWYPGELQGTAIAQVLFGDINPSGRLSASWPAASSQLPPFSSANNAVPYERADTGRGYRFYDRNGLTPLYPFGYGLSYTTFQYSNLTITPNPAYVGQDVIVTATVQNTGTVAGDEVPQLYIGESSPRLPRPVKELRGFTRVTLTPGQQTTVSFTLHEREFAYFDTTASAVTPYAPYGQFVAQPDNYTIMVGPSSANLPLSGTLTLQANGD
jgi:beta-glucosidase